MRGFVEQALALPGSVKYYRNNIEFKKVIYFFFFLHSIIENSSGVKKNPIWKINLFQNPTKIQKFLQKNS